MDAEGRDLDFAQLVGTIRRVHEELASQACKAVNIGLTLRNWLFGCYIAEYELNGLDRANYGDRLLTELAARLTELKISNCNIRQLYRYLRFYRLYPEIAGTLSPQLKMLLPAGTKGIKKVRAASAQSGIEPEKLLGSLPYNCSLLMTISNELFPRNRVHPGQLVGPGVEAPDRKSLLRTLMPVREQGKAGVTGAIMCGLCRPWVGDT